MSMRHPADESIPGAFISNDGDILPVHVDPPTSTGKTEDVKLNAGTAAVPCSKEPPAPRGVQLPGCDPKRSGAGASDPVPPPIAVDGF